MGLLVVVCEATVDSDGEGFDFRCWFGDEETVVADVLAVRGRSADAWDTMAPDVEGILPPISILRIRDLSSSNSSHTDAAGPVDPCDSVPSAREADSNDVSTWGVRGSYDRFEGLYGWIGVRVDDAWLTSGWDERLGEANWARKSRGERSESLRTELRDILCESWGVR